MEELTRTHVQLLDRADEDSFLFELPLGLITHSVSGETFETYSRLSLAEAQRTLADLLRRGFVSLYEADDYRDVPIDDALAVVADPAFWAVPQDAPRLYGVVTTESGERALLDAWPRFFDEHARPHERPA
ncbi:MAG: hypothetical protein ICV59_07255 [Thermoleophilia bacterium]|nr:hypothetical protein [Thermoleophilia bacterium]